MSFLSGWGDFRKGVSRNYVIAAGVGGGLAVILAWHAVFIPVLSWILVLVFGVLGFILGVALVLSSGKRYQPKTQNKGPRVANLLFTKLMEMRSNFEPQERNVVTSMNLDLAMQEVMDLVTRDYVMSWYNDLGKDPERFKHNLQTEVWYLLARFSERVGAIDRYRFLTQDVVNCICKHFTNIRFANKKSTAPGETRQKFLLHPWLASEERELEFLRKVAEVFLIYLLPENYASCASVRHLLREILACTVFKPAVDLICDPDYINFKIYGWLDYREQLALEHKRTYTYAATYEDFMKMLQRCTDIEHLKQMRYNIISEIMQATTIQNLKRAKGEDTEKETVPKGTTKGDLLRARNLKRYINQLTITKNHCERRINLLGGPDYSTYTDETRRQEMQQIPGKMVYSFQVIMDTAEARNYMLKYLHKDGKDALLRFWTAVESMKQSSKRHWHEMASEIYQMFITHPASPVRSLLDRGLFKGMEAFMRGDAEAEAFFVAQGQIYQYLEEHYYPSFILSDIYHHYIAQSDEESTSLPSRDGIPSRKSSHMAKTPEKEQAESRIAEHSTYAQQKLQKLDEKIKNKNMALEAMKRSQKADRKIQKLMQDINGEIESLRSERRQLEFHVDRTEVWAEHVGSWRANIYNAEIVQEEDKMVPYFVIVVHLPGAAPRKPHPADTQSYTQGWVISRKLLDFQAIHTQLMQLEPSLKKLEIPSVGKFRIKSIDTAFLDRAKSDLDKFLSFILQDDHLGSSEAAFAFFSPSPEHLKLAPTMGKKKFSFANFFRSSQSRHAEEIDSDDELVFVDEEGWKEDHSKDSVAKPLYLLLGEVFELQGMFKWMRRTLMAFVRVSFGRSINRQLSEMVEWIVSEPMLIYYIQQFRDAYWPGGQLADAGPSRTDEEKLQTRMLAKEKFINNMPDAVNQLFGERNAKHGAIKFFEALQEERLNKNLFYELLELFLYEAFPELHQYRDSEGGSSDATSNVFNQKPILNLPRL